MQDPELNGKGKVYGKDPDGREAGNLICKKISGRKR